MKFRKIYRHITCATRQKIELHLCCSILAAEIDTKLFEDGSIKNNLSCFIKEIDIDFPCVPIQLARRISKLLGFNVLGKSEKKHN